MSPYLAQQTVLYLSPTRTKQALEGINLLTQKLKARVSSRVRVEDLDAAYALAIDLEDKAREIRDCIRQDKRDLEDM